MPYRRQGFWVWRPRVLYLRQWFRISHFGINLTSKPSAKLQFYTCLSYMSHVTYTVCISDIQQQRVAAANPTRHFKVCVGYCQISCGKCQISCNNVKSCVECCSLNASVLLYYTHTHIHTYTHTRIHTYTYASVMLYYTHTHIHTYTHAHIHICISVALLHSF